MGTPALAEVKLPVPAVDQSMVAKRGFFYVGGHYVGDPDKKIMEEPDLCRGPGAEESAPPLPVGPHSRCGRKLRPTGWGRRTDAEGWAEYFVSLGYVVYMVDQPMLAARSAYHPGDGATRMYTAQKEQFQFTAIETDGTWPGREKHTQWPGEGANKGKMGNPVFDHFYATQVETVISTELTEQRNQDAGGAIIDKIAPQIAWTHSQSGPFSWLHS